MKIRNGFVSNSSSSSFVILGNYIDIKDVTPDMIKDKSIYALCEYLNEGRDVFKIKNVEMLAFLQVMQSINYKEDFEFVDAIKYVDCESEHAEIDLSTLPKTGIVKIIDGDADYRAAENLNDLQDRYDSDGRFTIEMKKYIIKEKVKKIEK